MGPERTIYKSAVPRNYSRDICNLEREGLPGGDNELRALTDYIPINTLPENMRWQCRENIAEPELTNNFCVTNNCQPSCVDIDYGACVLPNGTLDWDSVLIYRPHEDIRQCPPPESGALGFDDEGNELTIPSPFDLNATYNWTSSWITDPITGDVRLVPPDPTVIYQSKTNQVPTNYWSWCTNEGWDAPHHYAIDYKGAQTGAITDTTMCAPTWRDHTQRVPLLNEFISNTGCSARKGALHYFFPGNNIVE